MPPQDTREQPPAQLLDSLANSSRLGRDATTGHWRPDRASLSGAASRYHYQLLSGHDNVGHANLKRKRFEPDLLHTSNAESFYPHKTESLIDPKLSNLGLSRSGSSDAMRYKRFPDWNNKHQNQMKASGHDARPIHVRETGTLRGRTSTMPFIVEDDMEDEIIVATQEGGPLRLQNSVTRAAALRAEERQKSQSLRARAIHKRQDQNQIYMPKTPSDAPIVIDLCSSRGSSPEAGMDDNDELNFKYESDGSVPVRPNRATHQERELQMEHAAAGQDKATEERSKYKMHNRKQEPEHSLHGEPYNEQSSKMIALPRRDRDQLYTRITSQQNVPSNDREMRQESLLHEHSRPQQDMTGSRKHVEIPTYDLTSVPRDSHQVLPPTSSILEVEELGTAIAPQRLDGDAKPNLESVGSVTEQQQDARLSSEGEVGDRPEPPISTRTCEEQQQQQQRRDERIQKMKIRNQQNRDASHGTEADEEEIADSLPTTLTFASHRSSKEARSTTVQQSGQPLDSRVNDRLETNGAQKQRTKPNLKSSHYRSHGRRLGEVLYEDFKLMEWNQTGTTWAEIKNLFYMVSGKKRGENTLRKRCRQVQIALRNASIPKNLIAQATSSDGGSIRQINESLQTQELSEVRSSGTAHEIPLDLENRRRGGHSRMIPATSIRLPDAVSEAARPRAPLPSNSPPKDISSPRQAEKSLEHSLPERSTVGGKTISWDILFHYLDNMNHDSNESEGGVEEEKLDQDSDSHDELTEQDRCHFVYRVERRECTAQDLEDDLGLDDCDSIEYDLEFGSIAEANAAAARLIYKSFPGKPRLADPNVEFSISHYPDEHGMKCFVIHNPELGLAETRVTRVMRTFHEGLLPSSDAGMTSRTVFFVKWRIINSTAGDGLFVESQEAVQEGVNNSAYTVVSLANQEAINRYVGLTFHSTNINLTARQQEKQLMVKRLRANDPDDEHCFNKTLVDHAGRKVEVWVEAVPLQGPRNLF